MKTYLRYQFTGNVMLLMYENNHTAGTQLDGERAHQRQKDAAL